MMSEHYVECRALPTINETFPQFSARLSHKSQQPQQLLQPASTTTSTTATAGISRNNLILSPLDLSLRAGVNIVPITPPSTPSPPRKRPRFMSDEQYLWRPHVMGTTANSIFATATTEHNLFLPTMSDTKREELHSACGINEEAFHSIPSTTTHSFNFDNNRKIINNFEEITRSQRCESSLVADEFQRRSQHQQRQHFHQPDLPALYMNDETIVLTEDEDDENDEEEDDDYVVEQEEENETLLSSQELNEDDETNEPLYKRTPQSSQSSRNENLNSQTQDQSCEKVADDEEEEYVDILGNDDEDDTNPLSAQAITMLRLQSQTDLEKELEKSDNVLTRNKLFYENEELHNRAIDGLAKLFDRNFQRKQEENQEILEKVKTYIDLTNCQIQKESTTTTFSQNKEKHLMISSQPAAIPRPYKTHKAERKRMKLRKHMSLDEETISPVSGTIIRKLRDDEELVVRKGDIDPAFNVVEVTEEAKAILASIDNKIGEYLCQLCRTLYDDAFKLAQHRCPRIVHIEYKCSECEKVFNCPANLASHRRWHKPKSELLANSQSKKRTQAERNLQQTTKNADQNVLDDGVDGIYPCNQCGKAFRRHAYLKKHHASHQMLENLKSMEIFKNTTTTTSAYPSTGSHLSNSPTAAATRIPSNPIYPALQHPRPYPARFAGFPFSTPFDHRRFYTLGEFYLSQQLERSSAFQYVQANHLRNLSNVSGNFINRPVVPTPILPLPVK